MNIRYVRNILTIIIVAACLAFAASAKENKKEAHSDPELFFYGEILAFNKSLNAIRVMYYEAETNKEKAVIVYMDKNTKIENGSGTTSLKKGTLVNIAYTVVKTKNIARRISIEKKKQGEGEVEDYFNTQNENE